MNSHNLFPQIFNELESKLWVLRGQATEIRRLTKNSRIAFMKFRRIISAVTYCCVRWDRRHYEM